MEWISKRYTNFCVLRKRVSSLSAGIILKENYDENVRVIIGFSEDRRLMHIKKSDNGVKLSLINNRSKGRTFSSVALVNQFGEDIIGRYEFKGYEDDGNLVLERLINERRYLKV